MVLCCLISLGIITYCLELYRLECKSIRNGYYHMLLLIFYAVLYSRNHASEGFGPYSSAFLTDCLPATVAFD